MRTTMAIKLNDGSVFEGKCAFWTNDLTISEYRNRANAAFGQPNVDIKLVRISRYSN